MSTIAQVVSGEGEFEQDSVQRFVDENGLAQCKTDYQVVAIMGPQSSGKSTLLNHVFGTSFQMMDAMAGRGQTTKGIWLSKSPKVTDTTVLVMDLEGSDGRERGEDDTNFERQSALFALSVADVLLVNIWCHDIGREHGAGKPLLKTIFQVNLKLFAPEPDRKRTVLLFVLRDKTRTPLPKLVEVLEADLDRMWDAIAKPKNYEGSKMTDFFEVQYAALSHFEERYEDFVADSVHLRRRFSRDGDETLIRGEEKLPGDAFALSIRNIWEVIRNQKDLNLPAHKVMVANIRCHEIMEDQLRAFAGDQAWASLREGAGAAIVEGFGGRAAGLADSCIRGYESEAIYFDASVREAKRAELVAALAAALQPPYRAQVAAQQAALLAGFDRALRLAEAEGGSGGGGGFGGGRGAEKGGGGGFMAAAEAAKAEAEAAFAKAFERHLRIEGTEWDGVAEASELSAALAARIAAARKTRMDACLGRAERQVASHVSGPAVGLLEVCAPGVWGRLYGVCAEAAAAAERSLMQALDGYGLSGEEAAALSAQLRARATCAMQGHVREAALTRLSRMKDRFQECFSLDDTKAPRMWGPKDDIPAIAHAARQAAAGVLAQLAVVRPPPVRDAQGRRVPDVTGDAIEASIRQLSSASAPIAPDPASRSALRASSSVPLPSTSTDEDSAATTTRPLEHPAVTASRHVSRTLSERHTDLLSAAAWPGFEDADPLDPDSPVLLSPLDVRTTWREFMSYSNVLVQQALSAQQSNRLAASRPPPVWALVAMLALGWNEAMALLFNPVYLLVGVLSFLFLRSLYTELDVEGELARGALPGALRLSHKFAPACQTVIRRTQEAVMQMIHSHTGGEAQRHNGGGPTSGSASAGRPAAGAQAGAGAGAPRVGAGVSRRGIAAAPDERTYPEFTDLAAEGKKDQ